MMSDSQNQIFALKNGVLSKFTSSAFIVVFILNLLIPLSVARAQGTFGTVSGVVACAGIGSLSGLIGGATGAASSAASVAMAVQVYDPVIRANTGTTAGNTSDQVKKEDYLDCIFYNIAKMALRAITASIVSWASTGFQGNPAFVQNPSAFFRDLADQEIGRFIYDLGGRYNWICSPFRFQIKRALVFNRSFRERSQCTLTGVVKNFKDFTLSVDNTLGNIGGWDAWNVIATEPQNNPYGAYALANVQVEAQITGSININKDLLNFGKGFFSWRDPSCMAEVDQNRADDAMRREDIDLGYARPEFVGPRRTNQEDCKIFTPGSVIASQVDQALDYPARQLIVADEVNEVIGALIQGLAVRVLGGNGLAGLGKSSSGGGYNYSAQLIAEDQRFFAENKASLVKQMTDGIDVENRYIKVKNQTVPIFDPYVNKASSLLACYTGSASSTSPVSPFTGTDVADALSTRAQIISYQNSIGKDIITGETNITNLQSLVDATNAIQYSQKDQLSLVAQQYSSLFSRLHGEGDVTGAEYDRDFSFPNLLSAIDAGINQKISDCNNRARQSSNQI